MIKMFEKVSTGGVIFAVNVYFLLLSWIPENAFASFKTLVFIWNWKVNQTWLNCSKPSNDSI